MKKINLIPFILLVLLSTMISSCAAISGIFNAGMSFGIFIVVLIIVGIAVLVMRSNKN